MARQPIGAMEHVGIVMEDLAAARKLFADTLRLPVVDYPDSADGRAFAARVGQTTIRVVTPAAQEASVGRKGCNHVAFQVTSLAATRDRLHSFGVRTTAMQTGSGGRPALWVDPTSTIGIPVQFVEKAAALQFPAAPADGFIERVDHLGIAAHSHALARDIFSDGFGFPIECTQIDSEVLVPVETTSNDKYGSYSRSREPIPLIGAGLMAVFITVGDYDFEVMQPLGPANITVPIGKIPGSVGQDQGAISHYLEKRGEGLLHICFKTPDIRQALARVAAADIKLIDAEPRPGSRSGLIAFMDRRSTGGLLMHFMQRTAK